MNGDDAIRAAKSELRRAMRVARAAIPEGERARRSAEMAVRLLALPPAEAARSVSAFSSFGSEVSTAGLIDALLARGTAVALPVVTGGRLEMVAYRSGDALAASAYGALEPVEHEIVDPPTIDVVVTPGLAFDPAGRRLGYGRGYFDRFLRRLRTGAVTVGLAFSEQVVDSVPAGQDDVALDLLVTDAGVVDCRRFRL